MNKAVKKNIFQRVEQKYLLTKEQFLALQNVLDTYFEKDKYYKSNIYNLYFDNTNNDIIINSIEKPPYKHKIRLRSYKEPTKNDEIFLEIKKKYKGTVYKRRISLTLEEWNDYYKKDIFPLHDTQIMKEIDYEIKYFKLKPTYFVAYNRISYYSKEDENFRVIEIPDTDDIISPIVYTVPLQLLAYHVAIIKGTDVDQPRNLAKSVTVE